MLWQVGTDADAAVCDGGAGVAAAAGAAAPSTLHVLPNPTYTLSYVPQELEMQALRTKLAESGAAKKAAHAKTAGAGKRRAAEAADAVPTRGKRLRGQQGAAAATEDE